jgi:hypothetical protein
MLKELLDEIAQLPTTTKAQLRNGEQNAENRASVSCGCCDELYRLC